MSTALRGVGVNVREHDVTGPWPRPAPRDRHRFAELLASGNDWLVDNIVGSAAPEAIAAVIATGSRVTLLMHYFPCDDPALSEPDRERLRAAEAEAVRVTSHVVVTSAWAARQVALRYGRDDAVIARPGVRPSTLAPGSATAGDPPRFLWLGRVSSQKDPLTFVDALSRLQDLPWSVQLVGPNAVDPVLSEEIHRRLAIVGLIDRVEVLGPQTGDALDTIWAGTDLLVHTSRSETYGMVVTEALSRGIPSVIATGTGAVEAQKVGGTFPRGDAAALARELRSWLTDPLLQERWRHDAADARAHLPTWQDTAGIIASALAL